jgi:hypothetical protein
VPYWPRRRGRARERDEARALLDKRAKETGDDKIDALLGD